MIFPVEIYGFDNIRLFVSIEDSYYVVSEFLDSQGVSDCEINDYIIGGMKRHINGRTTIFTDHNLIIIKMNYFDDNVRSLVILEHEINHASRRIIDTIIPENKEEAECYMSEYILEKVLSILKPKIEYAPKKRNMDWFYSITH